MIKQEPSSIKPIARTPKKGNSAGNFVLPIVMLAFFLLLWWTICFFKVFPAYTLPTPADVMRSFREELASGRLINDIVAALWRVAVGFVTAALLGIPVGLWLGQNFYARKAFVPMLNFFRFLSPLAWIPFAILWFHIGDKPAIFLIFMATFFPLILSTMAAIANIPKIYFRVANDYNYKGLALLIKVTFP